MPSQQDGGILENLSESSTIVLESRQNVWSGPLVTGISQWILLAVLWSPGSIGDGIVIKPLVGLSESIQLDVILHYDTLVETGKTALLKSSDRTVRFYSPADFKRVISPYHIFGSYPVPL